MRLKKLIASILAAVMLVSCAGMTVLATETLPNAEVIELGAILVDSYDVYDGKGLVEGGDPIKAQIAMQFIAKDTEEQAKANAYAEYTTDFFVEINGMANGTFDATDCYLIGNYGTFGWVKVPLDGMTIEEGKIYPVISSVGFDFSYVDICTSVQDFKCGIYLSDKVLAENPDLTVSLSLGLSENLEAAQAAEFITVDEPYVYTAGDLLTSGTALPNAEVIELGAITIDDYDVYDGKGLVEGGNPIKAQIAMQFVAKDTEEQAKANAYAEYTTDFFVEINGMANGTFDATDCYLIGNYGTFGWVKVPLDGMTIEEGKIYPVISSVGFDFSYVDICTSVQDFKCGIYLSDKVLAENPDLTVSLSLGLSENLEAAQAAEFITVDEPYVYTVDDLTANEVVGTFTKTTHSLSLAEIVYIDQYVTVEGFYGIDLTTDGGLMSWYGDIAAEDAVIGNADITVHEGLLYDAAHDRYAQQTMGIFANHYGDTINMRFYAKTAEGEYIYSDIFSDSVVSYCNDAFAKGSDELLKKTCAALLYYGAAAETYFDGTVSGLVSDNVPATYPAEAWDANLIDALKDAPESSLPVAGEFDTTVGHTLSLVEAIAINFYFTINDVDVESAEMLVWGADATAITADNYDYAVDMIYDSADDRWAGQTELIYANNLGDTVYAVAKVVDTEGNVYYSPIDVYSPEHYAQMAIENSSDANMVELAERMVIYGENAVNLFA